MPALHEIRVDEIGHPARRGSPPLPRVSPPRRTRSGQRCGPGRVRADGRQGHRRARKRLRPRSGRHPRRRHRGGRAGRQRPRSLPTRASSSSRQGRPRGIHRPLRHGGPARGKEARSGPQDEDEDGRAVRAGQGAARAPRSRPSGPRSGPARRRTASSSRTGRRDVPPARASRWSRPCRRRDPARPRRGRRARRRPARGAHCSTATNGHYVSLEPDGFGLREVHPSRPTPPRRWAPSRSSGRRSSTRSGGATPRPRTRAGRSGQARPRYEAAAPRARSRGGGQGDASSSRRRDVLSLLRAAKIAKEFKLKARYVGAGDEYRLPRSVAASKPDLVAARRLPAPAGVDDGGGVAGRSARAPAARSTASPSNPKWLRDAGVPFSFTTAGLDDAEDFDERVREAMARGLSEDDALAAVTTIPARQLGLADRLGTLEPGRSRTSSSRPASRSRRRAGSRRSGSTGGDRDPGRRSGRAPPGRRRGRRRGQAPRRRTCARSRRREAGPLAAPKAVVVRGATVWTQGRPGSSRTRDLLVVGRQGSPPSARALAAPAGRSRSTAAASTSRPASSTPLAHRRSTGRSTRAPTRHRRGADPRRPRPADVAIYRELAGGTTTANVLHGSANAIGGQNAIIKWRWGGGSGRPALRRRAGRASSSRSARTPSSRTATTRAPRYPGDAHGRREPDPRAFLAARDYRQAAGGVPEGRRGKGALADPARAGPAARGDRRDPRGQAADPLPLLPQGRDPEMLRVAEEFGVKIGTLQHVLEGYKVADEIAKHGAGALDASPTGGPTSSRSTTRSPTTARSCTSAACSCRSTPTRTSWRGG